MKIVLDCQTILAVLLIIVGGIFLIYLPHLEKGLGNVSGNIVEHFPSSMRQGHLEVVRREPKILIPKIVKAMHNDANKNIKSLPDDYMYLYNYEKNFDSSKVYGDFSSRLDGYQDYLLRNKNNFHSLEENDIDNLTGLLNGKLLKESDIPNNFKFEQEFKAVNH